MKSTCLLRFQFTTNLETVCRPFVVDLQAFCLWFAGGLLALVGDRWSTLYHFGGSRESLSRGFGPILSRPASRNVRKQGGDVVRKYYDHADMDRFGPPLIVPNIAGKCRIIAGLSPLLAYETLCTGLDGYRRPRAAMAPNREILGSFRAGGGVSIGQNRTEKRACIAQNCTNFH